MTRKILPLPPQTVLHELLHYDKRTGVFTWRKQTGRAVVGAEAGWLHSSGYVYVGVSGKYYKAHRLAWKYVYGEDPAGLVDHIDRDPTNNRIKNLRLASEQQSNQNKRAYRNSSSGHKGVGWFAPTKKWRVRIQHEGRVIQVGCYEELTDALAARQREENRLHTHAVKNS